MKPTLVFDFDGSLTEQPGIWRCAIQAFRDRDYRVICMTQRVGCEENIDTIDEWMEEHNIHLPVYFTDGGSKLDMLAVLGIAKYIMIDDDMKAAVNGR